MTLRSLREITPRAVLRLALQEFLERMSITLVLSEGEVRRIMETMLSEWTGDDVFDPDGSF